MKELLDRLEAQALEIHRLKSVIAEQNLRMVQMDEQMSLIKPTDTPPPHNTQVLIARTSIETLVLRAHSDIQRELVTDLQRQIKPYITYGTEPTADNPMITTARAIIGVIKMGPSR